jgi:type III secretory pathway lipoprotein EscJ
MRKHHIKLNNDRNSHLIAKIRIFLYSLITFFGVACKQEILHDLSEQEANRLLAKLHSESLSLHSESLFPIKKQQSNGQWSIAVEDDQVAKAVTILDNLKLFAPSPDSKVESTSSIFASNEDIRLAFEQRKGNDIAHTLKGLADVLQAKVHLNIPNSVKRFGGATTNEESSASVILIVDPNFNITAEEIKGLVGGAVGIPQERVQVLLHVTQRPELLNGNFEKSSSTKDVVPKDSLLFTKKSYLTNKWRMFAFITIGLITVLVGAVFLMVLKRSGNSSVPFLLGEES